MRNAAVFWSLGALLRSLFAGRLAGALAVGCIVVTMVMPSMVVAQQVEPVGNGLGNLPNLPANGGPNLGDPRVSGSRTPQVVEPVPWDAHAVDGRAGQPVSTRRACELRGEGWQYTEERVRMRPPVVSGHDFSRELTVPCRNASLSASGGFTLPQHCDNGVNGVISMLRDNPRLYVRALVGHGDATCVRRDRLDQWQRAAANARVLPLAQVRAEGACGETVLSFLDEQRGNRLRSELVRRGIPPNRIGSVGFERHEQEGGEYRGFDIIVAFEGGETVQPGCIPPPARDGEDGEDGNGNWFQVGGRIFGGGGYHEDPFDTWAVGLGLVLRILPNDAPVGLAASISGGFGAHDEDADERLDGGAIMLVDFSALVPVGKSRIFELSIGASGLLTGVGGDVFFESQLVGGGAGFGIVPNLDGRWLRVGVDGRYLIGNQGPDDTDVWETDAWLLTAGVDFYLPI